MGSIRKAGVIAIVASALGACATQPDLTVQFLTLEPAEGAAGDEVVIQSTIRNEGDAPAAPPIQAALHLAADQESAPLFDFGSWQADAPLAPGAAVVDEAVASAPSVAPGAYVICAEADPDGLLAEKSEDNNRLCAPFMVLAAPLAAADLVIDKVTPLEENEASLRVRIRIRNAGVGEASRPFRVMAFKRSPREPLYLKKCPLTEGQLAAGSPSHCGDVIHDGKLAAGAAAELEGYFNYFVSGAEPLRQPLKPGDRKPRVTRTVDFMVDGCFKPAPPDQAWCAINEIDEINNFKAATLKAR